MAETQNNTATSATKSQGKKRKRDDNDKPAQNGQKQNEDQAEKSLQNPRKKKTRRSKKGERKTGTDANKQLNGTAQQPDREEAIDDSIGQMNEQILADYFMQKAKAHNKDLTAVELSDMSVPGNTVPKKKTEF